MRILTIIVLLFSRSSIHAQKLSFRVEWDLSQSFEWKMNDSLLLDDRFYEGYRYYVNQIKPYTDISPDLPGTALEFRFKNNTYISSGLNYSRTKFWDGENASDPTKSAVIFRFHRASLNLMYGKYFRGSRPFKPYLGIGVSGNLLRASFDNDHDYRYVAYLHYFNTTPIFLSAILDGGLRFGGMRIGIKSAFSLTPTSKDGKMGQFRTTTLFSFAWDLIRTSYLKKSQFKEKIETDDIHIKRSQVLKQNETSWSLYVPIHFLIPNQYLSAWSEGSTNYIIQADNVARSSFIPGLTLTNINALNTKRTWYWQTFFNIVPVRLVFEKVKTVSTGLVQPLGPGDTFLTQEKQDIKAAYNFFSIGTGSGFKIKTSPRSYIFGDAGLQLVIAGRNGKGDDTIWEMPPLKKKLILASIEGGLKMNHFGISLQFDKDMAKLDKYDAYKGYGCLSLKFTYDVASN